MLARSVAWFEPNDLSNPNCLASAASPSFANRIASSVPTDRNASFCSSFNPPAPFARANSRALIALSFSIVPSLAKFCAAFLYPLVSRSMLVSCNAICDRRLSWILLCVSSATRLCSSTNERCFSFEATMPSSRVLIDRTASSRRLSPSSPTSMLAAFMAVSSSIAS